MLLKGSYIMGVVEEGGDFVGAAEGSWFVALDWSSIADSV